jgi:GYF domain 2
MPRYYFAQGATEHGPYSAAQLRELAAAGQIQPTAFVWQEGSTERHAATKVKGLFANAPSPAPAAEPSPPAEEPAAEPKSADSAFTPAAEQARPKAPEPERPRRVVSIKGGILVGQDGHHVQFRKKCPKCGYEEPNRTTTVIRPGAMRIAYFCRKCRKGRTVEMQATS